MNKTLVQWRETRAVEMALAGLTFDSIAEELGYANRSGPWKAVRRAMSRRQAQAVDEYRRVELERLRRLEAVTWPDAVAGDTHAAELMVGIVAARSRLLQL